MADRKDAPVDGGDGTSGKVAGFAAQASEQVRRLRRLAGRFSVRESQLFLLLAIVVGLLSGLAVVCFRDAIELTRIWSLGSSLTPPWARTLLAPTLAGVAVSLVVLWAFPLVRGSGVNQTKAAVYIFDGYIPFRTVVGKFITCTLAIGCGFSLGPEDPALQMGAGIASAMGRRLRLSQEKTRLLAPVGAAAGLAAAFNAPIAAVLFVIEEVIGTWSAGGLGAIVLAAVSSVVVMQVFLGSEPIFNVPPLGLASPIDLLGYAVLGVVGGFASLAFLKFLAYIRPLLRKLPRWTIYIQPAVAGLLIGLIGLAKPQVMGAGYVYVDQAIHNQYTWQTMGILGGLKILTTGVSFVSGTPGGMFAPAMFIGATLGGAVGGAEQALAHHAAGTVGAFALVGIGTLFAGFLRAPITSVFMVVEVSRSYSIILPVMISNTIAYLISRRYQRVPLFDMLSRQEGIELPSLEEQREQPVLRVEHAMTAPKMRVVRSESLVAEALALGHGADSPVILVRFPSGRWATVERAQLQKVAEEDGRGKKVAEVVTGPGLPTLHRDQPLDEALAAVQSGPVAPVVSRVDPGKLEGVLTLEDVLAAYREAGASSET